MSASPSVPVRVWRWATPYRRRLAWLPNVGATISAAAGGVVLVFAPLPDGGFRQPQVSIGIGLIVLGVTITSAIEWRRARQSRRDHEERLQFQESMNDAVLPIIGGLAETADGSVQEREAARVQAVGNASTAMRMLLQDCPRARVIVYRARYGKGRKPKLEAVNYIGRKDKPSTFTDGTPRGTPVFEWLAGDEPTMFVDDVTQHPPQGWQDTGHDYKTFISARIAAGTKGYGMLCVDSPDVGDLLETDVVVVDLVASLLGLAFAHADRKP